MRNHLVAAYTWFILSNILDTLLGIWSDGLKTQQELGFHVGLRFILVIAFVGVVVAMSEYSKFWAELVANTATMVICLLITYKLYIIATMTGVIQL